MLTMCALQIFCIILLFLFFFLLLLCGNLVQVQSAWEGNVAAINFDNLLVMTMMMIECWLCRGADCLPTRFRTLQSRTTENCPADEDVRWVAKYHGSFPTSNFTGHLSTSYTHRNIYTLRTVHVQETYTSLHLYSQQQVNLLLLLTLKRYRVALPEKTSPLRRS